MEGREKVGIKLDQNRVCGIYWTIREQVGQQKTRDQVSRIKQEIREQGIGKRAHLGTSDWEVIKIKNTVRNE